MKLVNNFFKLLKKIISKMRFSRFSGKDVNINWLSHISGNVYIGDHTNIIGKAYIDGLDKVQIGKWCAIGYSLNIISINHKTCYPNMQSKFQSKFNLPQIGNESKGEVKIGNGVWIGNNVIILSGVDIGNGAVIGAGSVVTKDIPPYAVAAGNPAVVKKYRFDKEKRKKLEEIDWYNWTDKKIKKNLDFFETDLTRSKLPEIK